MKHVIIDGACYPVTMCPCRTAKGADTGKRSAGASGRHFAMVCYNLTAASQEDNPDSTVAFSDDLKDWLKES